MFCIYVCAQYVHQVLVKSERKCQIPWSWSYKWLWQSCGWYKSNLGVPKEQPVIFSHWAIFPAPQKFVIFVLTEILNVSPACFLCTRYHNEQGTTACGRVYISILLSTHNLIAIWLSQPLFFYPMSHEKLHWVIDKALTGHTVSAVHPSYL